VLTIVFSINMHGKPCGRDWKRRVNWPLFTWQTIERDSNNRSRPRYSLLGHFSFLISDVFTRHVEIIMAFDGCSFSLFTEAFSPLKNLLLHCFSYFVSTHGVKSVITLSRWLQNFYL
jgi:hypothetical protein